MKKTAQALKIPKELKSRVNAGLRELFGRLLQGLKFPASPHPGEEDSVAPNKKLFFLGGVVLALVVFLDLGVLIFWRRQVSQQKEPTTVEIQEIQIPQESLETIKREEWALEVLNGSGVVGAAAKAADTLESLGYKVVKAGNADRQDYKGNLLFVSPEMLDKADLLVSDLSVEFNIASVSGELEDSTASARIILGRE